MILLVAVVAGVIAGILRARVNKVPYQSIAIKHIWLVLVAYLPQFFAFSFPATRSNIPDQGISILLILSQIILIVFIWLNRKMPGGWLMGLGLILNFLVIVLNGGMMPLSPQNAQYLVPDGSSITFTLGERVGWTKDILLERPNTNLWFLSDIFRMPKIGSFAVVYSIGDVCLSLGAFWLFWELGNSKPILKVVPT